MIENQISFSQIKEFYEKIQEKYGPNKYGWDNTIKYYIEFYSPFKYCCKENNFIAKNLLELLYYTNTYEKYNYNNNNIILDKKSLIIPTISQLVKKGIRIRYKEYGTFNDIDYDERTSTIFLPQIYIYHYRTEIILKNLLAYEICKKKFIHPIRDYILFMDYIIDTSEDVQILIDENIIINKMGNSKEIATLFNNLSKGFSTEMNEDILQKMEKINIRYNNKIYNLKSIFINTYFDNYIKGSVSIVAFMIVICTILQTIFTIIPEIKN